MAGLVGLDQLSGFSDLISLFFAVMMGWVHSFSNWVWSMMSGAGARGGSWVAANWMRLLIVLVVTGLALDWVIWMLRWQPYRLWFRGFRRKPFGDTDVLTMGEDAVQYADSEETLGFSEEEIVPVAESGVGVQAEVGVLAGVGVEPVFMETENIDDYGVEYAPMLGVEYAPELGEQPDIIPVDELMIEPDDYRYDEPVDEYQPELITEFVPEFIPELIVERSEGARRWPWRGKTGGGVRTVTGKPAKRRGLLRLAGDDDEAIPGLPPMMTHDEGYNDPTLPPEGMEL
ncbi:hypothetical protein FACS1894184_01860 [Clostridia bacterium]|nr:hypothetical protein FACS1894184_01860 [Clostridia bacterium]